MEKSAKFQVHWLYIKSKENRQTDCPKTVLNLALHSYQLLRINCDEKNELTLKHRKTVIAQFDSNQIIPAK